MLDLLELVANLLSLLSDVLNHLSYGLVDTTLQIHRIRTCCYVLQTYTDDSLSQNRCGCRTVTRVVVGLRSNLLHQLCAHVLERASQLNLFCHCHTILRDVRCAKLLLNDHVATLRAQCHLNGIRQLVHALLQEVAGIHIIFNLFCHDCMLFLN